MNKQSAKKIPSRNIDKIFGISKNDLIPIIEHAIQNSPVTSLEICVEYESLNKGMRSETIISTFSYETKSGIIGDIALFVKRQLKSNFRETPHYIMAAEVDIPTPRFYGHLIGNEGEEVLFLEFLPECGIDDQNAIEVQALISLIARINTAPLRCDQLNIQKPVNSEQQTRDIQHDFAQNLIPKLRDLWKSGAAGEVSPGVQQLCSDNPKGVEILKRYAFSLAYQIAALPEDALAQGDTGAHNMGWRRTPQGRELVVFDLNFHVGRRFYDIAYIMHNQLGDSALSLEEIGVHYLAEYQKWGGEGIVLEDFMQQTRILANSDMLWSLPWLWQTALEQKKGGSPGIDENQNDFAAWLHDYLKTLLMA